MATNSERTSAVIYQFPKGGRAAMGAYRGFAKPRAEPAPAPVVDTDGWYHQAAVEDDKKH